MQNPQFLVLENPGNFESLDEATADKFEEIERKTFPLLEKIIQPFVDMNKERTRYTNINIPKEEVTDTYTYGDITVSVKTTPTTLKTNYKAVVEETENFLNFVKKDYKEGRIRKGVLTIDNKTYVGLEDVINKIKELKESALKGKKGIRQEVKVEAPPNIKNEGLEKVIYKLRRNYSIETEENAADYTRADALKKAITNNFHKKFIKKLEERTGYDKDHLPPHTTQEFVRVDDYLFPIQVTSKENPSYASIINAFVKPYNKRITENTGELIRLKEGLMDDILTRYAPRIREGKTFVLLDTIRQRMKEIKVKYTNTSCDYKRDRSIRIN